MNITDQFLNFALLGAEWVLWLLVVLSVLSVGVMVERVLYFQSRKLDPAALAKDVRRALSDNDVKAFESRYGQLDAMAVRVARRGLDMRDQGTDAVAEAMSSEKTRARAGYERYLIVLGTLGNNAPFIGLFGTVLGIIQAFYVLKEDAQGGAEAVMAGISEALVATAVGLLVAIPAVIAFNYFNRVVRGAVTATDDIAHTILSELHGRSHRAGKEKA